MIEFYAQIKAVHVAAVLASGGLLAFRGLMLNLGYRWVLAAPIRLAAYAVDTTLLTAALMLTTIVHQYPFVDAWLTAKSVLVVFYLVLGSLTWRARGSAMRLGCWLAALAVFAFTVSVALARDPLGVFSAMTG
ncbi:MAG: SirB2 family protein [Alphaproteobacteria bacterium]|nr:SirB2 family protein [Alphaproteobacteria bacterium]